MTTHTRNRPPGMSRRPAVVTSRRPLRPRLVRAGLQVLFFAFAVVWTYPLSWAILASFKSNTELLSGGANPLPGNAPPSALLPWNWDRLAAGAHPENYGRAWYVASFQEYFLNSIIVTVAVTLIVLFMTCLSGYALGRHDFPGKKVLIGLYTVVTFLPEGYTIIPVFALIKALHLQNSLAGVIVAVASGGHLLYILLFTAYFSGLPRELADSAAVDGAGFVRTFTHVMLPLARPALATVTILEVIRAWNDFFMPLVFTASKPELQTIAVGLYTSFLNENTVELGTMSAGIVLAFVPVVVVFLLLQRYFVEGIAGAVKS